MLKTPSRRERAALDALQRVGVTAFLPTYLSRQVTIYGKRSMPLPLFPSYLFSHEIPPGVWPRLTGMKSVRTYIRKIGHVSGTVVEEIAARVGPDGHVKLDEPAPDEYRPGEDVIVTFGSLSGLAGVFKRDAPAVDRVVILLSLMGCEREVELPRAYVRRFDTLAV